MVYHSLRNGDSKAVGTAVATMGQLLLWVSGGGNAHHRVDGRCAIVLDSDRLGCGAQPLLFKKGGEGMHSISVDVLF